MALLPLTLQVNRSLNRIAGATRGELAKLACDLTDVPWVRQAWWKAIESDIRCLGRFDLTGPDGRTPWPSVLFSIRRRPQRAGQTDRTALVAVYMGGGGEWEASVRESDKVPWKQFKGTREGEPSVLNGDRPSDAPVSEGGF